MSNKDFMLRCSGCKELNAIGTEFCTKCGTNLNLYSTIENMGDTTATPLPPLELRVDDGNPVTPGDDRLNLDKTIGPDFSKKVIHKTDSVPVKAHNDNQNTHPPKQNDMVQTMVSPNNGYPNSEASYQTGMHCEPQTAPQNACSVHYSGTDDGKPNNTYNPSNVYYPHSKGQNEHVYYVKKTVNKIPWIIAGTVLGLTILIFIIILCTVGIQGW